MKRHDRDVRVGAYAVLVDERQRILLALWKFGILASIGTTWIAIGLIIAIGIGIMIAAATGRKSTIEVDRS